MRESKQKEKRSAVKRRRKPQDPRDLCQILGHKIQEDDTKEEEEWKEEEEEDQEEEEEEEKKEAETAPR